MTKTRIAIHGAAGRMGRRLVALGAADDELTIVAALDAAGHPQLGEDAGLLAGIGALQVPLTGELPDNVQVDALIDFSVAVVAEPVTALCVEQDIPLVMATTGLSETAQAQLYKAAETIPLVWAPNMSMAVNLTMKLAEMTAQALRGCAGGVDVEILERHHRFKEDAPSGTALQFGHIIADEMGLSRHVHGREGHTGARTQDEIGYHAIRTGDNPGEHTIVFGMLGETIELRVAASNRDCYAMGALAASKFVARQQPGLYGMNDVLGI